MALLKVLKYPDPRLRIKAKEVEQVTPEVQKHVSDMIETMYHDQGGGLAAIQVNIPLRIFTMDFSRDKSNPQVFINPIILEREGKIKEIEGCLSFPGVEVLVERSKRIKVQAMNEHGEVFEREYIDDYPCRCVQHEIDHLDGITFFDRLSSLKRQMIEKKYRNFLKNQTIAE